MKPNDLIEVQELEPGDAIWHDKQYLIIEHIMPTIENGIYVLEVTKLDGSERKIITLEANKKVWLM